MAASLASSLATTFSVALRRTSLLPTTVSHQPTNLSLTKPFNFPSIRAQSGENEIATFVDGVAKDAKTIISDGKEKVEEVAGKAMEMAADGWKEGKEKAEEGFSEVGDLANELAGSLGGGADDLTEISIEKSLAVKESVEETAKLVVEKGGEEVKKGVDTVVAVKDLAVEVAGDLAEKTTEMVEEGIESVKGN